MTALLGTAIATLLLGFAALLLHLALRIRREARGERSRRDPAPIEAVQLLVGAVVFALAGIAALLVGLGLVRSSGPAEDSRGRSHAGAAPEERTERSAGGRIPGWIGGEPPGRLGLELVDARAGARRPGGPSRSSLKFTHGRVDTPRARSWGRNVMGSIPRAATRPSERRTFPRAHETFPVMFAPFEADGSDPQDLEVQGIALNLSAGGICLETPVPLERGRMVRVAATLPVPFGSIECTGNVVWCCPGRGSGTFLAGIEFWWSGLDDQLAQRSINTFLRKRLGGSCDNPDREERAATPQVEPEPLNGSSWLARLWSPVRARLELGSTRRLLRRGPEGVRIWNETRLERCHRLAGIDLAGVELCGVDFRECDLSDAILAGSDLRFAHLIRARLGSADLRRCKLRAAQLIDASLLGTDLRGADLGGCDLHGADLRGADLADANLRGANLAAARFRGARLVQANLRDATLSEASLAACDLRGADLRGAELDGTRLRGAALYGADFTDADLREADLVGVDLKGVHLGAAELPPPVAGPTATTPDGSSEAPRA